MSQPGNAEAADGDDAEEKPAHMSDFLEEDDEDDEQHPSHLDGDADDHDDEEELLRDPAPRGRPAQGPEVLQEVRHHSGLLRGDRKNIIDDAEIGLRLHAALDSEAADYLEDVPAKGCPMSGVVDLITCSCAPDFFFDRAWLSGTNPSAPTYPVSITGGLN